jgi:hypothetical protein
MRSPLLLLPLLTACSLGLTNKEPPGKDRPQPGDSLYPWDSDDPGDSRPGDPDNQPPVADAGADQVVAVDEVVELDGFSSYDPEGAELIYAWEISSMPAGSGVTLINPTFADPVFIPDRPGEYLIELVVDDGDRASLPDTVLVTSEAPGDRPVANAGNPQSVDVGDTVRLDGSLSYDPGGEPLSYAWSFQRVPSASSATLSNASSVNPSFVAYVEGTYEVMLVVSDSTTSSEPDGTTVVASADSGDDCGFGCAKEAEIALRRRLGSTALVLFPLFLGWRIRRRDDEPAPG